jgi:ribonuclease HII
MPPSLEFEQEWQASGYHAVAGVDEAGRGCWAGPVVAAAVVLSDAVYTCPDLADGIDDSKLLRAEQRAVGAARLRELAAGIGVGMVPAYLIDAYGIVPATRLAMMTALLSLPIPVDAVLVDAVTLPGLRMPQQALIRGDARSLSIAAASVIAKVLRDQHMTTVDQAWPGYGFAAHKGYGTAVHQQALARLGPCTVHRRTFRPVLKFLDTAHTAAGKA